MLKAMHTQLLKHVREPDQMGYLAAKKFIDKLASEARFTPQQEELAVRKDAERDKASGYRDYSR